MEKNDYQLVIRIPFKAIDQPQARQKAQTILTWTKPFSEDTVVKLQELREGAPPKGVPINTKATE